jgi:hypothetical protein
MDVPLDYFITFACILANIFNLMFPYVVAFEMVNYLAYALIP